jgi:hypothetical protein
VTFEARSAGLEPLIYEGTLTAEVVQPNTVNHHLYMLDRAAYRLRKLSNEIVNTAQSSQVVDQNKRKDQIQELRTTLDLVRREVLETRQLAMQTSNTGATTHEQRLQFMRSGKASRKSLSDRHKLDHQDIVARLELVDALANRLSHVVWEYDKEAINGVRICAILADSRQHLPLKIHQVMFLVDEHPIAN